MTEATAHETLGLSAFENLLLPRRGVASSPRERVAVLIPARNEEHTVYGTVRSTFDALAAHGWLPRQFCLLVVADRCTDDTTTQAAAAGARVLTLAGDQGGLGVAFDAGIRTALNLDVDVIATIDADGQYDPRDLVRLLHKRRASESSLVVGNRLAGRPRHMSRRRYFANRVASRLILVGLETQKIDTQSGLRVFTRGLAERCRTTAEYTYTQEQVIRAVCAGERISTADVGFHPRLQGQSRLRQTTPGYCKRVIAIVIRSRFELSHWRRRYGSWK